MKAIQVPSFTAGQRIITTLDPTDHRGRAAIAVPCGECDYGKVLVPMGPMVRGMYVRDCTACNGLGSLIVASAVVTDCVPVVEYDTGIAAVRYVYVLDAFREMFEINLDRSERLREISDQLPYADFSPDRWAWLLDDVQPTAVRCPACWGEWEPCRHCLWPQRTSGYWMGSGHCPPIPVKAEPGLWEWTP